MEVVRIAAEWQAPVFEPLGHDEPGVQERHGEHDERADERDQRVGFQGALDDHRADDGREQVRPAVAHEHRRRVEVEQQEAECGAGDEVGQDAGRVATRSNAMIENATAEIAHTPAARPSTPSEKFTTFISATSPSAVTGAPKVPELDAVQERQRERLHLHTGSRARRRPASLPASLINQCRSKTSWNRADDRDQRRAGEDALRALVGEEDQSGDKRAAEVASPPGAASPRERGRAP